MVWSAPEATSDGSAITLEARATYSGSPYGAYDDEIVSFVVSDNHSSFSSFYFSSGGAAGTYEARTSASGHANKTVTFPFQYFPPLCFVVNDPGDSQDKIVAGTWGDTSTLDDVECRFRTRPDIPESAWGLWSTWANATFASNGFGHDLFDSEVNYLLRSGTPFSGLRMLYSGNVYEWQIRVKSSAASGSWAAVAASDVVTVTGPGTDPGAGTGI